jgi:hypothetical protein
MSLGNEIRCLFESVKDVYPHRSGRPLHFGKEDLIVSRTEGDDIDFVVSVPPLADSGK